MAKKTSKLEVIDMRCLCGRCEDRTKETYKLNVSCSRCGWKGIALLRKGDSPDRMHKCPNCECAWVLIFGYDPKFDKKE